MKTKKGKGGNTTEKVYELALPIAQKLDLKIWDITFEKEGSLWYLRVLIERPGGSVDLDDCENMTRPLSDELDKYDPIPEQYILEVGSPGSGRKLTKREHFEEYMNCPVRIRLIRETEGIKEFLAVITSYEDGVLGVETENGPRTVDISDTAFIRLYDDDDYDMSDTAGTV